MPTLYCSRCSRLISFDDTPPRSCPDCGFTFDNAADSTNLGDGRLPETITATLPPHKNIGRYEARFELGAGAFGTVFLAYDPKLDRLVAIKCPNERVRHNPEFLERFAREGRNAAQLRHAAIVTVYDVEENEDGPYIVSEYVKGETLSRYLRRGRLSFRTAASIVAAVAAAVQYAHVRKIVHRDIKPSNVMIDESGNPRLMDFGLAKREDIDETVTVDNQILGTIAYMSPEQLAGKPQGIDYRTDIYSLGVMLYQLLTEKLPFRSDAGRLRTRILNEEAPRPRTLDKQIPIDLETICLKAMERDRERRYKTAGDMAEDLERWLHGEPILARHIGRPERAWRWAKRNPAPAGLVSSIGLLLISWAVGSSVMAGLAEEGRRAEKKSREVAEDGRTKEAAARKREAELRALEGAARRRAEIALRDNRRLLARAYVHQGERYVRAAQSAEDYSPLRALPWFLEATKLEERDPESLSDDRIRMHAQMESAPAIERMWFFDGGVRATGMSEKRDIFFIAGDDGRVNVWRVAANNPPLVSLLHPGCVCSGAFSPDGTRLATGAIDGVRIWEIPSGKLVQGPMRPAGRGPHAGSREDTRFVAFSQSGRSLFSSALDGVGQIWDVGSGQPVGQKISVRGIPIAAAFADSDRLLVVPGEDNPSKVYDARTGKEKRSLQAVERAFRASRPSPDGTRIAALGISGAVTLWNAVSGQQLGESLQSEKPVNLTVAAFSFSGKLLATGSDDGTTRMWDVSAGQLLWARRTVSGPVDRIEFSPDDSAVAVVRLNEKVCPLAVQTGESIAQPIGIVSKLISAAWADTGEQMLTVSVDGVARLWKTRNRMPAFTLPHETAWKAAVSSDRRVLAIAEPSRLCVLTANSEGRFALTSLKSVSIRDFAIDAIELTDNGTRAAISGERQAFIWDTVSQKEIVGPLVHSHQVIGMRFAPGGTLLVCVSVDGYATVWNAATGRRLYEPIGVGNNFYDICIDSKGDRCAVATMKGVTIWDLESGRRERPGYLAQNFPRRVHFLPNGTQVLVTWPNTAQVWDIATGRPIRSLPRRADLRSVDLSADRKKLLTVYGDGFARLWFSETLAPVSPLLEHPSGVRGGTINQSASWALTYTENAQIYLWDARTGDLLCTFSLPELQSRFLPADTASTRPTAIRHAFFSVDGRSCHLLTGHAVLFSIDLGVEHRSLEQLTREIALLSGTEFDGAGGLRILEPRELRARWEDARHSTSRSPGDHSTQLSFR